MRKTDFYLSEWQGLVLFIIKFVGVLFISYF